jgi:hypothetical protein
LAREETVVGLAEVQAKHGGGSGIAFAWETQLLATPAPATQAASDSAERGAGRMEPAIWIAQGMSATAFSRADMPAASEGGNHLYMLPAGRPPWMPEAEFPECHRSPEQGPNPALFLAPAYLPTESILTTENQALEKLRAK